MNNNTPLVADTTFTNTCELTDLDCACIDEIKNVLKKYDRLQRFELSLLQQHFDLDEGEVLAETNNPICRTVLVEPVDQTLLTNNSYFATSWRFDGEHTVPTRVQLID